MVENDSLLWGMRVFIPREWVLQELHDDHPGVGVRVIIPMEWVLQELHDDHPGVGVRVIIPMEWVLQELHDDHPGVSKMNALARSHVIPDIITKQGPDVITKC